MDAHYCKTFPGREKVDRVITSNVIAQIDGLIRENRRITEKQIRVQVGIKHGSVKRVVWTSVSLGRGSARVDEIVDPSAM